MNDAWRHLDLANHAPLLAAAVVVFVVLAVARRVPLVRTLLSLAFSTALVLLLFTVARRQAAYDPVLDPIARRLGLDEQVVAGREVRVPMASDGHFWARANVDGVARRMLIDSGATVTALSPTTAAAAGLDVERGVLPVVLRTANGTIAANTARVGTLRLGDIVARDLAVVVSPGFGDTDVLGMNFLSRLKGWRVEGRTLILTPHHPTNTRG
ncbi:retropepsin-like aspartic protease family protein [Sphingomonas sp.]|uniref:retropepsin-like aspartic protease family protein n=1 Tax=Sphingomonas sp. TaxID=28214 RepID=UPI003AFFB009